MLIYLKNDMTALTLNRNITRLTTYADGNGVVVLADLSQLIVPL